jgi:hypothetical protein
MSMATQRVSSPSHQQPIQIQLPSILIHFSLIYPDSLLKGKGRSCVALIEALIEMVAHFSDLQEDHVWL